MMMVIMLPGPTRCRDGCEAVAWPRPTLVLAAGKRALWGRPELLFRPRRRGFRIRASLCIPLETASYKHLIHMVVCNSLSTKGAFVGSVLI